MSKIEFGYLLSSYYDEFLIKKGKENKDVRGYLKFHPSAFGGCLRRIVLQYFGEIKPEYKEPNEIKPVSERIFNAGHFYHHRMQFELAEMGILRGCWRSKLTGKIYGREQQHGIFRPETMEEVGEKIPDGDGRSAADLFEYVEILVSNEEYNFHGHVDGIIEFEKGNLESRTVIDFKTAKNESFMFLKNNTRRPSAEYITQINIYMWLLDLQKGIVFFENKNDHELLEFAVERDNELIEQIKTQSKKILDLIQNKKIPKIPEAYSFSTKPCAYCGYRNACYKK